MWGETPHFLKKMITKEQTIKLCEYLINNYQMMTELPPKANAILMELFTHHPNYKEKVGSGIDRILITLNFYGPGKCFALYRKDKTFAMISWMECVKNKYK